MALGFAVAVGLPIGPPVVLSASHFIKSFKTKPAATSQICAVQLALCNAALRVYKRASAPPAPRI